MTYEDALANCIDLVEIGTSVDTCLVQYPEHARELEPTLRMVAAMAALDRPQLSTAAFERGRVAMAAQIQASNRSQRQAAAVAQAAVMLPQPSRRSKQRLRRRHSLPKPYTMLHALTSAVAAAVLLLSIYSLARSVNTSLPGDRLYATKRASEEVQGALMAAIGESAAWHAGQVERRIEESIALRNRGEHVAADLSTEMEEDVQRAITASAGLPVAERQELLEGWLFNLRQLQVQTTSHGQFDTDDDPVAATVQQTIDAVENAAGVYPIPAVEPSPTPTSTRTSTPTSTSTSTLTPTPPTLTATSTAVATATPTMVSVAPPVVTIEPLPTSTLPPTDTPLPPPTATPTRRSSSGSKPDRKTPTPTLAPPTNTPVPPTPIPSPEVTGEPTAIGSPVATSDPTETPDPDATATPETTPDATGTPSETDVPTAEATDVTPEPNETPDTEQTPEMTDEPTSEATDVPEPGETPASTAEATTQPTSESTPKPTDEVTPDATPLPETTSEATSEPAPTVPLPSERAAPTEAPIVDDEEPEPTAPPPSERAAPTEAPIVDDEEPAPAITAEPADTPLPADDSATPEGDDP